MAATWTELPETVRVAVTHHTGHVTHAENVTGGRQNDLALALTTQTSGRVFLKGAHGVSRRMRMLRNETRSADLAPGIAPHVLFAEDVDGWLVVGFEYLTGRPADLTPGSPDLPLVAATVEKISTQPATGLRPLRDRWNVDWWSKLADEHPAAVDDWDCPEMSRWAKAAPELATGDQLAHTDLHAEQFIIDPNGPVHVIDWAFPGAAAPWVDAAYLTLRLIDARHSPADAEAWARSLACTDTMDAEASTAFAVYIAGMWTYWSLTDGPEHMYRARLARRYASWRLTVTPTEQRPRADKCRLDT